MARPGNPALPDDLASEAELLAKWVSDFCSAGYGPHGGNKLLVGLELDLAASPAAALRDLPTEHPLFEPYRRLATSVHAQVGDQATLAVMLCAQIIIRAAKHREAGVGMRQITDGLTLAKRQGLAWINSKSRTMPVQDCLAAAGPAAWIAEVLPGLQRLAEHGVLDLDAVHIRAADGPIWQDGLAMDLHGPRRSMQNARVLLLQRGPKLKPTSDAVMRLSSTSGEEKIIADWFGQLDRLGVDLVICGTSLGDLRERIESTRLVADGVEKGARRRLELTSGASPVATIDGASAQDLGVADVSLQPKRIGGWIIEGPGPGATFNVGKHVESAGHLASDAAERLLRATGAVLEDSRALPGGGKWQSELASSLAKSADAAPGRAAYGINSVASALEFAVAALRRNAGQDPLDKGPLEPTNDAAPCVIEAYSAAIETATAILRIDARYGKKSSNPADMRGGLGKAGSPKGMPGDIPPLM